ncbi:putative FAD binding domain protein [Trichodelitschia bisporula]|uniref:Putative FAD binding domain protein n=1 Tax=Trichodelitschia bisporula TaxID=703511 RepID=A0A6G1I9Z4_9PEZI|nr:putative FAD binding domain protein [Trichodelitschia bisporula]
MHFSHILLPLCPLASARCTSSQACWPPPHLWSALNTSLSGALITPHPPAAPCHLPTFPSADCTIAKANWTSSPWRTSQAGAYSALLWESPGCGITTPPSAPCPQGRVPVYAVAATTESDVQTAVRFAATHNLYLVVKNTGHDHLGRSSGAGSFGIWTHGLKGRTWHSSFVPEGAPAGTKGQAAVTLRAGEQWLDVYADAGARNVTVTGGSARTVGAAGGYMTGGGHSPFASWAGLAVDNLLQARVVGADGRVRVLNKWTEEEWFWALRGGGGCAFGVVVEVTYRVHPGPKWVQAVLVQINGTGEEGARMVRERALRALPAVVEGGYVGYADMGSVGVGFQAVFSLVNGTEGGYKRAFVGFEELGREEGVRGLMVQVQYGSWMEYAQDFLRDPNIATNVLDASKLVSKEHLMTRAGELVALGERFPEAGMGFNFIGKVNQAERNNTSVHPSWATSYGVLSYGVDWTENATAVEQKRKKEMLVEISKALADIMGKDTGTYVNEANPYEPDWENVFWGKNYARLLRIKRRIDPQNLFVCNRCVGSDIVLQP